MPDPAAHEPSASPTPAQPSAAIWVTLRHPAFRSLKLDDDVGSMPIFSRIEEQFGERVAEVRQQIEAVAIRAPIATLLETETDAPGLRLTRQYLNARGEVIEMAINTHPADRYSYSQTFRRDPESSL